MDRKTRAAMADVLRWSGKTALEIAREMGISRRYVAELLDDPEGAKSAARKRSYAQPCERCGAPTSGSDGRREHPLCLRCAAAATGLRMRKWTEELIVERIREWAEKYGEPPATPDWNPWTAAVCMSDYRRARRFEEAEGYWPTVSSVVHRFGSWNAGIAAAGFEPRASGGGGTNRMRRRNYRRAPEAR